MKKRVSRMISAALALALCLGMSLIPASAAEAETSSGESGSAGGFTYTVAVEGVTFYVSGDTFAVGSELTVGTEDLEEGGMWNLNIHLTQSGSPDRYAAVTPEGEQTDFFTANQVNDYMDYLNIPAGETRTFTLTIPEEYADWNVAVRFGYGSSFGEIPLEEVEDVKIAVSEAVTNAVIHGYEEKGGIIRMVLWALKAPEKQLSLSIEDSGKGICDIEKAMEPMFTTDPSGERSGMGFSFMEAFMDHVSVESEPGKGTRVLMEKKIGR